MIAETAGDAAAWRVTYYAYDARGRVLEKAVFDADDALWSFDRKDYLTIAKLTAILRVSNSLDRGHRQKFQDIEVAVKDNMLVITAHTFEDITLEKAYFTERVEFFEEVYGLKPVIKQKR